MNSNADQQKAHRQACASEAGSLYMAYINDRCTRSRMLLALFRLHTLLVLHPSLLQHHHVPHRPSHRRFRGRESSFHLKRPISTMPSPPSPPGGCQKRWIASPPTCETRRFHIDSSRSLPECTVNIVMSSAAELQSVSCYTTGCIVRTYSKGLPCSSSITSLTKILESGAIASFKPFRIWTHSRSGQSCKILCM